MSSCTFYGSLSSNLYNVETPTNMVYFSIILVVYFWIIIYRLKNGDAKIIKNAGGLVISAFDSAMRSLIVAIYELGVKEIMVVAHSHCGACHMSYDHFHHEMIARGVTDETLDTIRKCGINLDHWLEGFKDTPESVRKTVDTIKTHPLVPKDIVVRGFIIDSETGALEEIVC